MLGELVHLYRLIAPVGLRTVDGPLGADFLVWDQDTQQFLPLTPELRILTSTENVKDQHQDGARFLQSHFPLLVWLAGQYLPGFGLFEIQNTDDFSW